MLKVSFTPSCHQNIALDSITLHREGRGDASDILRVYALQGVRRVSKAFEVRSSNDEVEIRFRNFRLPACKETVITFAADLSPSATVLGEHRLMIRSPADIHAGDAVITGNFSLPSQPQTIVPGDTGTVSVSYLPLPLSLSFGEGRIVSRFRLEADRVHDQEITALTLTNDGKARGGDLQHLRLENDRGDIFSESPDMDGDRIKFVLKPPLILRKNHSILLHIRGNVLASRRKTIQFLFEEPSDIEALPLTSRFRKQ